jgi:hypothetical protein
MVPMTHRMADVFDSLPRTDAGTSWSTISFANLSEITEPRYIPLFVLCCRSKDISQIWPSAVYLGVIRMAGRNTTSQGSLIHGLVFQLVVN